MADEKLTLVLMKDGQPLGDPIQVGKFEHSSIYNDKVAFVRGHCPPYKVDVHISRLADKGEKSGKRKPKRKVQGASV